MKSMSSRERIKATIAHKPTDKIPVDMGAANCTGINVNAYINLKNYLNINKDVLPKIHDLAQQLAYPETEILDRLGADFIQPDFGGEWQQTTLKSGNKALTPVGFNPRINSDGTQDWLLEDGQIFAHMPSEGSYYDLRHHQYANVKGIQELDKVSFGGGDEKWAEFCAQRIKAARINSDRAIVYTFGGNILEGGTSDFGFSEFMELLLTEEEFVHKWARKKTDAYLKTLEILMPKIAEDIDVIAFGDDLGTQSSTLVSVKTYKEMIHPYHKEIYGFVKERYPHVGRFLHSCGAIEPLIPLIIDEGIQILNPVQISASGMDAKYLKRTYGKDLVFWGGGANMQHTVQSKDVAQIIKQTQQLCETFYSDNTGFVFNTVHNIQSNVSPQKILAIFDTVKKLNQR